MFLECQAVPDFGSVLGHRDKYRALFPTTNSSVHLVVLEPAEPDGTEVHTAYSSRAVSSMGWNRVTSSKRAQEPLISPATYLAPSTHFFIGKIRFEH